MRFPKPSSRGTVSCLLLVGLSIYWAVSTFTGIEESFSSPDLIAFCATGGIALLVQILIILIVDWWFDRPILTYAVTGLLIVLNAFSFNLIFAGDFLLLGPLLILLLLAAGWFVATVVVRMTDENRRLRPFVFAAVAALIASPFILMGLRSDARTTGAESSEFTASPNVRKVDFKTKPNVYFIGFDSAVPAAILSKYLGLRKAPLDTALKDNGFRIFPNLFVETISTSRSWKMLLSLDRSYYESLGERHGDLMSGLAPSPLIQIFRHNGYQVSTLYQNSYFGPRKGPHVDFYRYNKVLSVCDFVGPTERQLGFYGACFVRRTHFFPRGAEVRGSSTVYLRHYLTAKLFKRDKPQVLFVHLHPPSHVDRKTFRRTPQKIALFRNHYASMSRTAARNLSSLKRLIVSHDPNAIVFVFGDHGVYLSNVERFEDDKAFFIQDRFGVLGGIFPANTCTDTFDAAYHEAGYMTTTWVARLLVKCLAGGDDPFATPYNHDILFIQSHRYDPKRFLYE